MSQNAADTQSPEFHLVVRRTNPHGPLAPYRLGLAVAFAVALAGGQFWDALNGVGSLEDALLRGLIIGLFMWIVSGIVNKILTVRDEQSMSLSELQGGADGVDG